MRGGARLPARQGVRAPHRHRRDRRGDGARDGNRRAPTETRARGEQGPQAARREEQRGVGAGGEGQAEWEGGARRRGACWRDDVASGHPAYLRARWPAPRGSGAGLGFAPRQPPRARHVGRDRRGQARHLQGWRGTQAPAARHRHREHRKHDVRPGRDQVGEQAHKDDPEETRGRLRADRCGGLRSLRGNRATRGNETARRQDDGDARHATNGRQSATRQEGRASPRGGGSSSSAPSRRPGRVPPRRRAAAPVPAYPRRLPRRAPLPVCELPPPPRAQRDHRRPGLVERAGAGRRRVAAAHPCRGSRRAARVWPPGDGRDVHARRGGVARAPHLGGDGRASWHHQGSHTTVRGERACGTWAADAGLPMSVCGDGGGTQR